MPGEDEVSLIEIEKLAKRIATILGTTSPADSALFKIFEDVPDRLPRTVFWIPTIFVGSNPTGLTTFVGSIETNMNGRGYSRTYAIQGS